MMADLTFGAATHATPVAKAPIQHQAGSPKWTAYQVAIPDGWMAVAPVVYPILDAPDEPARQGIPAALLKGFQKLRFGVLLRRPEADGQAAFQEFEADASLEAAFLGQDGQYLQAAQTRPAYAVIPLAVTNSSQTGRLSDSECLVLIPSMQPPLPIGESYPAPRMFVDGCEVNFIDAFEKEAA